MIGRSLNRFDIWLRAKAEARYGPMNEWRLAGWLQRRAARRYEQSLWYSPHSRPVRLWRKLPVGLRSLLNSVDRDLRILFEMFFGPMESWRLALYLRKRSGIDEYPDPSIGRGAGSL